MGTFLSIYKIMFEIYQEYKIMTLNVNGLHNVVKRSRAIAKIKREKTNIIFWQETHLSNLEHEKKKRFLIFFIFHHVGLVENEE